jgi:hypothetical protein
MEPEGSLPCSQEPSIGPYPEPDRCNPYHPILSKIHFNIVTDLINPFPGNGFVNTRNNGSCVSVEECYSPLLGSSQRANELAG